MRDVKVVVGKTKDVTDQVKHEAKAIAGKVMEIGNRVIVGTQAVPGKMVDAGNQAQKEAEAITGKVMEVGNQVKRGTQTVTSKVTDAGGQIKCGAKATAGKVMDAGDQVKRSTIAGASKVTKASKEKLFEILALAEPNLSIFRQEVADASKKYTNAITHTIDLTGQKLRKSAELVDPDGRYKINSKKVAVAFGAAIAGAYTKILAASPSFTELPQTLKTKIAVAGLRPEQGWRSIATAERFYDSSVPDVVRNFGKDAVVEFLDGKHASHITSVHNDPSMAIADSNIVWEAAGENLSRGSTNMTGAELTEANIDNLVDAAGIVAKETLEIAAVAACVGMALEGVVSLGENLIYVYAGERTAKEATIDVAKNMAKKGILSAVSGGVISVAIACGAGPVLSSMAPVMITIGGTVYLIGAVNRITKAYKKTHSELEVSVSQ